MNPYRDAQPWTKTFKFPVRRTMWSEGKRGPVRDAKGDGVVCVKLNSQSLIFVLELVLPGGLLSIFLVGCHTQIQGCLCPGESKSASSSSEYLCRCSAEPPGISLFSEVSVTSKFGWRVLQHLPLIGVYIKHQGTYRVILFSNGGWELKLLKRRNPSSGRVQSSVGYCVNSSERTITFIRIRVAAAAWGCVLSAYLLWFFGYGSDASPRTTWGWVRLCISPGGKTPGTCNT